jgi:predicted ester cyclase/heme-degrading monooxygenase HmoA
VHGDKKRRKDMNSEELKAVVLPFYEDALTVNQKTTSTAVLERILAPGFQSINSQETKPKAALIKQVEFFWKLIPDLRWQPRDVVAAGNKVVVRSVASGSPKGSFMGIELDGTRSFQIDTIDIHEVGDDQIVRVHHLKDWATGLKQLAKRDPMGASHCVETATFQLKAGVTAEALLAVEARIRGGRIRTMPGYIGRELAREEGTDLWLMIMRFETRAQMDAWMAELKSVPEMREMGALIVPGSMTPQFFLHAVPPVQAFHAS